MPIDLTPFLIGWAGVTTLVLMLFFYRVWVAKEERGGIYIEPGEEKDMERQVRIARRLARIDVWGKTLTVVAAVLFVVLGASWLYNGWLTMK